jgi:hypothetical protein
VTCWRATVEKPDGAGGWTVVGVFGTSASPGSGTARHLGGDTPLEAAQTVLGYVWPVDLAEFLQRDDPGRWRDRHVAGTGIADHRITLDVDPERLWSVGYGRPQPEPLTVTVAELRLAEVRAKAAALAVAKAELKGLIEQVRRARGDVRHHTYLTEEAVEEATRAGVAVPDVAKAVRPPRQPRRKTGGIRAG